MNLSVFLLYVIIGIEFLFPFCVRYLGFTRLPTATTELVILGMFLITFINKYYENNNYNNSDSRLKYYRYFILSFLLISLISSILNQNNMFLVGKVFLDFSFIYLILFFTILELDINEKNQNKIINFIYFLIFLQIPISIYQYLFCNYPLADDNSGTISFTNKLGGGTGVVGILMIFLLSFIISKILIQGFTLKRLFLAILTFIPPIVGGCRFALILLPITILLTVLSYYFFFSHFEIIKFIKITIVSGIFVSLAVIFIVIIAPQTKFGKSDANLDIVSSPDKIAKYESGDPKFGRVAGYNKLFGNVFENNTNLLLGMGSGVIAQSKLEDIDKPKFIFISRLEDSIRLLGTTGLLGLFIALAIVFLSIPTLKNYIKVENSEFMNVVACSFFPSTIIFIMAIFYTSAWNSQIGFSYWAILGILYQRYAVLSKGYEKLSRYYLSFMSSS